MIRLRMWVYISVANTWGYFLVRNWPGVMSQAGHIAHLLRRMVRWHKYLITCKTTTGCSVEVSYSVILTCYLAFLCFWQESGVATAWHMYTLAHLIALVWYHQPSPQGAKPLYITLTFSSYTKNLERGENYRLPVCPFHIIRLRTTLMPGPIYRLKCSTTSR